jgi:hypothetical protein
MMMILKIRAFVHCCWWWLTRRWSSMMYVIVVVAAVLFVACCCWRCCCFASRRVLHGPSSQKKRRTSKKEHSAAQRPKMKRDVRFDEADTRENEARLARRLFVRTTSFVSLVAGKFKIRKSSLPRNDDDENEDNGPKNTKKKQTMTMAFD